MEQMPSGDGGLMLLPFGNTQCVGGYTIAVTAIPNLKTIPTFLGSLTQQCGAAIPQRVALVSGDVEGWQGVEAPLQQRF